MTIRPRRATPELAVSGEVAAPQTWTWEDLGRVAGRIADLGAEAAGFAGEAVPVAPLLDAAEPLPDATHCTVISDDGHYRASIPLDELAAKGWLAFRLAAVPLPRDRGGPLRIVVPQGRTLCWNASDGRPRARQHPREPKALTPVICGVVCPTLPTVLHSAP